MSPLRVDQRTLALAGHRRRVHGCQHTQSWCESTPASASMDRDKNGTIRHSCSCLTDDILLRIFPFLRRLTDLQALASCLKPRRMSEAEEERDEDRDGRTSVETILKLPSDATVFDVERSALDFEYARDQMLEVARLWPSMQSLRLELTNEDLPVVLSLLVLPCPCLGYKASALGARAPKGGDPKDFRPKEERPKETSPTMSDTPSSAALFPKIQELDLYIRPELGSAECPSTCQSPVAISFASVLRLAQTNISKILVFDVSNKSQQIWSVHRKAGGRASDPAIGVCGAVSLSKTAPGERDPREGRFRDAPIMNFMKIHVIKRIIRE